MNRNFPPIKRPYRWTVSFCSWTLLFLVQPHLLFACAACYGQSDSAMAKGMNFGILTLLSIIVTVLGGVAAFFVFLARRSAHAAVAEALPQSPIATLTH